MINGGELPDNYSQLRNSGRHRRLHGRGDSQHRIPTVLSRHRRQRSARFRPALFAHGRNRPARHRRPARKQTQPGNFNQASMDWAPRPAHRRIRGAPLARSRFNVGRAPGATRRRALGERPREKISMLLGRWQSCAKAAKSCCAGAPRRIYWRGYGNCRGALTGGVKPAGRSVVNYFYCRSTSPSRSPSARFATSSRPAHSCADLSLRVRSEPEIRVPGARWHWGLRASSRAQSSHR